MSDDIAGYRVSPAQQHLHRLRTGLTGTDPFSVRVEATLPDTADPELLRRSLLAQAADHEILRTRVVAAPGAGVPAQVIADRPRLGDRDGGERDGGEQDAPLALSVTTLADGTRRLSLSADPACADPRRCSGSWPSRSAARPARPTRIRSSTPTSRSGSTSCSTSPGPRRRGTAGAGCPPPRRPPRPAARAGRPGPLPARVRRRGPGPGHLPQGRRTCRRTRRREGALTAAAWALVLADGTEGDSVRLGVVVDGRGAPSFRARPDRTTAPSRSTSLSGRRTPPR
ncbi:hypothetical protein O1L68_43705 [Streptomyces lydicus]|nr:hypothetical protein [Streptomyces lydicus]